MASKPRGIHRRISSDSDNDLDKSYDMAGYTMSPASSSRSKSKGKATEPEKVNNLSFGDAVIDPSEEEPNYDDEQKPILPSWISTISGMQNHGPVDAAQKRRSIEKMWLQSAEQTTGNSDVESVTSNNSGLGHPETQLDENFTDLQLDADLHSVRTDIQMEADSILRILDDIHISDEAAVPRDISVQLRKHARAIAYIFGDDVISLKRRIKDQNEETQKLIRKHEAECTRANIATTETIHKLEKEKDGEIRCIELRDRSEIQKLRKQYEESEQRHQKQTALFEEKIALLKIDYPAYRALKGEHKKSKDQLEASEAQTSLLFEDSKKRDAELTQPLECKEKNNHRLVDTAKLRSPDMDGLHSNGMLRNEIQTLKLRETLLFQSYQGLKKENSALRRHVHGFQPAPTNKQSNTKLWSTLTGSLSGKYETITSTSTGNTLGPSKTFAEVAENNIPTIG
jgi:hypothetical protein